jgi:DNA-binding NtrC family response regulator
VSTSTSFPLADRPAGSEPTEAEDALRVLVVDDDAAIRGGLARVLSRAGFDVTTSEDGAAGFEALTTGDFDAALVDVEMPGLSGPELLSRTKAAGITTEIIIMTAYADVDIAVSAVKAGAFEFLTKPFVSNEAVAIAVRNAGQRRQLTRRAQHLEQVLERRGAAPAMLGSSRAMREMMRLIEGVAPTSSTVLILGESGAGKELVARALHERSRRAAHPLVTVNCAAIPKELVESELFGHVKGAFTGAHSARSGLFEAANGGTILLDEVGDLPLSAQVKLLRTLQSGEVRRVGSDKPTLVDVRVLAATNVDLKAAIEAGTFRKDFFYRLNVITIHVPPLRARRQDVAVLAHEFLARFARAAGRSVQRFSPEALRELEEYDWPGNVRELEHAIEHAVVLARGEEITPELLPFVAERAAAVSTERTKSVPPSAASPEPPPPSPSPQAIVDVTSLLEMPYALAKSQAVQRFNEIYLGELMKRAGSNITVAARMSGLDRSNFRRLLRAVGDRNGDGGGP